MSRSNVLLRDNGIIEIHVIGDQTVESVQRLGDDAIKLGNQQKSLGKPSLILDNVTELGAVPPEARRLVVDLIKSTEYDRLAMVGNNQLIRLGANLLLQASGKGSRVKYFDDYESATAWLLAARS